MKSRTLFLIGMALLVLFLGIAWLTRPAGNREPAEPFPTSPVPPALNMGATITTEMENEAQIKSGDNGKSFSYHLTDRFSVFLDDTKYPLKDLTCSPEAIIGYVSNGSLGGPGRYPIMFEAVGEGKCRLEDHDFHVDIIVQP